MNPTRIIEMASAFYESCALFAASDLGIFSKLAEVGKADARAIAQSCGLSERGTRLLLDACAALGLLQKDGDKYSNSAEAAAFLAPTSHFDLSKAIRYNRDVYAAWGRLGDMVRTGKPVERPEIHLGEDEDRTRTFALSMHGRALGIGRAVVPLLKLEGRRKLLDVGGGPGTYSMLIAEKHPEIECVVFDLPGVAKVASELIRERGMEKRIEVLAGNYHSTPFPDGIDAAIFFGTLHQESPDAIRNLFRKTFDAMKPGGILHVLDMMTDASRAQPRFSALFALNMALTTEHGWVFSDEELALWLKESGFADFSVLPLPPPMPHWLATARKPA